MGCEASRKGGCFCTGDCEPKFPNTNPADFAERFKEWKPGALCEKCSKPEAECFCVEPVPEGTSVFEGVFSDPEVAAKVAEGAAEQIAKRVTAARAATVDVATTPDPVQAAKDELNREYRISINKKLVDGVTVFTVSSTEVTSGPNEVSMDTSTETYIGKVGLKRLLDDLGDNLEHFPI